MATHASRDTSTGLKFEDLVSIKGKGINVSKHALYRFLKEKKY